MGGLVGNALLGTFQAVRVKSHWLSWSSASC